MFLRKIMIMHDYGKWEEKVPMIVCSPRLKDMYHAMREMFPAVIDGDEEDNRFRNVVQSITYEEFRELFMKEVRFFESLGEETLEPTDSRILRAVEIDLHYWGQQIIFRAIPYRRAART
ncbi:hypothetical protein CPT_Slocum_119 [Serratia phage Slocum]|nr:hypothetical protein CPT_Slocum_119 [Serratia phage Slocum]